jgi:gluconate 2-dehydrogenase alpha chain
MARGEECEQPAGIVILGAYVFNNMLLMRLAGISEQYDPVTGKGALGRNYCYQVSGGNVTVFFADKEINPFTAAGASFGTNIDDFNGDNFDHGGLGFCGVVIVEIIGHADQRPSQRIAVGRVEIEIVFVVGVIAAGGAWISAGTSNGRPIQTRPVPPGTPRWGRDWKKATARWYNHAFNIGACAGIHIAHRLHLAGRLVVDQLPDIGMGAQFEAVVANAKSSPQSCILPASQPNRSQWPQYSQAPSVAPSGLV